MAFTSTRRRYASFETAQSIPGTVIDFFWFIIDNNLKGVFSLYPVLNFELLERNEKLSIRFSQDEMPDLAIIFDTNYRFNPKWPRLFHAVDNTGRETIVTPNEL